MNTLYINIYFKDLTQLFPNSNCHMIYGEESQYTKEPLSTCICLTCVTVTPGDMWKATPWQKWNRWKKAFAMKKQIISIYSRYNPFGCVCVFQGFSHFFNPNLRKNLDGFPAIWSCSVADPFNEGSCPLQSTCQR